jgi:hypothetical protein
MENNMEDNVNVIKNEAGEVLGQHFPLENEHLDFEKNDIEQMSEVELEQGVRELREKLLGIPTDVPERQEERDLLIEKINLLEEKLADKESTTPSVAA